MNFMRDVDSRNVVIPSESSLPIVYSAVVLGVFTVTYMYMRIVNHIRVLENMVDESQNTAYQANNTVNELFSQVDELKEEVEELQNASVIQDAKYQGWVGTADVEDVEVSISLYREQLDTFQSNKMWEEWDGAEDGSVINRNYVVGNYDPDFPWELSVQEDGTCRGIVSEINADSWSGPIHIDITLRFKNKGIKKENLQKTFYEVYGERLMSKPFSTDDNGIFNGTLKHILRGDWRESPCVQWRRVLRDVVETE